MVVRATPVGYTDTAIKVKRSTRDRLEELKQKMGARSYDEVINALLDGYADPVKAMELLIYWMADLRNDVKTAVEELKKLNTALGVVRQGE